MKNRSFRLLIVAFCTILTQWGCQPTRDMLVEPVSQDISIDEAKSWLTLQKQARLEGQKRNSKRTEYWNLAQKQTFSNGRSVVLVPVTYSYQHLLALPASSANSKKKGLDRERQFIQSKLLVYKDSKGVLQADLIHIIPTDEDWRKNKRVKGSSFSGTVLVYTPSGEMLRAGYTYMKGKLKTRFRPLTTGNGRQLRAAYRCGFYLIFPDDDTESGVGFIEVGDEIVRGTFVETPCGDDDEGGGTGGDFGMGFSGEFGFGGGFDFGSGFGDNGGGDGGDGGYIIGGNYGGDGSYGVIFEDSGGIYFNPVDNFILHLLLTRGIWLTGEEEALIREYPRLIASLSAHIDQYGQKPDGSRAFKLSDADQARFPNFTQLVRDLPSFVKNDSKVRDALIHYTGYSEAKLYDLLKFGHGPQIYLVENLLSRFGSPVYGLCDCDVMDKPDESKMQIEENYVRGFEFSNPSLAKNRATAFFLAITILHEFVHYGRNQNQLNDFSYEFGETFELEAFGIVVGPSNAGKLSYRLYKRR